MDQCQETAVPLGEVTVPGLPECVAALRAGTRALVSLVAPEAVDAAELICSELAGNAVRHSRSGEPGQTMTLRVYDEGLAVKVAVTDRGSRTGKPRLSDSGDPLADSGRGLFLVQAMSKEWGVDHAPDGSTTVWTRLAAASHEGG